MPRGLFLAMVIHTLGIQPTIVNDPWLPGPHPFPELESSTEVERSNLDPSAGLQQRCRGVSLTILALAAGTA